MSMMCRLDAAEAFLKAGDPHSALDQAFLAAADALDMEQSEPGDVRIRGFVQSSLAILAQAELAIAEQLHAQNVSPRQPAAQGQPTESGQSDDHERSLRHARNVIVWCDLAEQLLSDPSDPRPQSPETREAEHQRRTRKAAARLLTWVQPNTAM